LLNSGNNRRPFTHVFIYTSNPSVTYGILGRQTAAASYIYIVDKGFIAGVVAWTAVNSRHETMKRGTDW